MDNVVLIIIFIVIIQDVSVLYNMFVFIIIYIYIVMFAKSAVKRLCRPPWLVGVSPR